MPFLVKDDLKTVIREYQLDAITDSDDTIVEDAIAAGIEEAASLLTPNDMNKWKDGRPVYDVNAIFTAEDADRSQLILAHTKAITMWHLVYLCNTGLTYAEAEGRYDRSVQALKDLAAGTTNSLTLPRVAPPEPDDELPWQSGSNKKFNHGNNITPWG